jgi:hypothetical protein
MTIQQFIQKYNDPLTGLFKNNAPAQAITAATLRELVSDNGGLFTEVNNTLPYALRTEWITALDFPTTIIGGGSSALVDSQPGYFGLLQLLTNVAAGGIHVTTAKVLLQQSILLKTRVYIPALSDAPQSFYYRYGLLANPTIRNQVDGIYFEYSHDINGGAWVINVYKASVLTQTLTVIPVAINTTYELSILVIPDIGARFIINDVQVSFIASGLLPTVAMNYANGIRKYNGATNRSVFIDSDLIVYNLAV